MTPSRLSGGKLAAALFSLLLAPLPAAADLNCKDLVIEDHHYDFSGIGGPHSVLTSEFDGLAKVFRNTSYTLDLCGPLKKADPKVEGCPDGTRVCAIIHAIPKDDPSKDMEVGVVPIAGDLSQHGGKEFTWTAERLSNPDAPEDKSRQGVRLKLRGGIHETVPQLAVVDLLCAEKMVGTEGEMETEDKYIKERSLVDRRDDNTTAPTEDGSFPERQVKNEGAALIWDKYEKTADGSEQVLHLTWHTKSACLTVAEDPSESRHWGLFTWLFMLVFLGVAAYLIFGSWLNYTRYGARGWDLLPHGDTLQDIPYLLKDWMRRFLNTVQSSGSRGGYSAV